MLSFNIEKKNCSGCSACYSVCPKQCITMVRDEEGFVYPERLLILALIVNYVKRFVLLINLSRLKLNKRHLQQSLIIIPYGIVVHQVALFLKYVEHGVTRIL